MNGVSVHKYNGIQTVEGAQINFSFFKLIVVSSFKTTSIYLSSIRLMQVNTPGLEFYDTPHKNGIAIRNIDKEKAK